MQKSWNRNIFACQKCSRKFHTKSTFERHKAICEMLLKSTIIRPVDYQYVCAICSESFEKHDDMVDHMKKLHNDKDEAQINCVICSDFKNGIDFTGSTQEMIRHGRYHPENATYKCISCEKFFPNGDEIITHLLRHTGYKPFQCTHEGCEKKFFDRFKLKTHMVTHDPNAAKKFVCEDCQKPFSNLDYLNCHRRRKHSKVKPYR